MRILVIEDDKDVASFIRNGLAQAGCNVDHAANGKDGLFLATTESYDALVVDRMLPGIDGLTVIREAKRYKADLPVIIITGFSTESSAIEAVNLGVAGYLTKPFRVPQVLAAAAKALGE